MARKATFFVNSAEVRLDSFGKYLHDGRHVSEEGGQFPVDHLDAAFAHDMTRVLLSHLSLMLTAEERRRQQGGTQNGQHVRAKTRSYLERSCPFNECFG